MSAPASVGALPSCCCGTCGNWDAYAPTRRQSIRLGLCDVRPGAMRTYTAPGAECTVRAGGAMAWKPIKGVA